MDDTAIIAIFVAIDDVLRRYQAPAALFGPR
jgi:hypothetical protein